MRTTVMEGSLSEFDLSSVIQVVSIGRQYTGVELFEGVGSLPLGHGPHAWFLKWRNPWSEPPDWTAREPNSGANLKEQGGHCQARGDASKRLFSACLRPLK